VAAGVGATAAVAEARAVVNTRGGVVGEGDKVAGAVMPVWVAMVGTRDWPEGLGEV